MKAAAVNGSDVQTRSAEFEGLLPAQLLAVHRCMLLSRKLIDVVSDLLGPQAG